MWLAIKQAHLAELLDSYTIEMRSSTAAAEQPTLLSIAAAHHPAAAAAATAQLVLLKAAAAAVVQLAGLRLMGGGGREVKQRLLLSRTGRSPCPANIQQQKHQVQVKREHKKRGHTTHRKAGTVVRIAAVPCQNHARFVTTPPKGCVSTSCTHCAFPECS
jgi:hypothetical protein